MALSEVKIKEYIKRLLLSRMRILCNHGFFGLLLMHVTYSVSEEVETACTDGRGITFGTKFLDELSDNELDFVMMHEIMHIVLQHCIRRNDRDAETFNIACDIVVNSNILLENNMDLNSITLKNTANLCISLLAEKKGIIIPPRKYMKCFRKAERKKRVTPIPGARSGVPNKFKRMAGVVRQSGTTTRAGECARKMILCVTFG